MKRIVLFEGIASSGKTTLERLLHDRIKDSVIVTEGRTLMPIFDVKDPQIALEHLLHVVGEIEREEAATIIVDRLHLTQAFRTDSPLKTFHVIEQRLRERYQPVLVLLAIHEDAILQRIKETDEYRAGTWVKKKQGTDEERADYYKEQQSRLKREAKESSLPVLVVDTTDKDWDRCLRQIVQCIKNTSPHEP